MLEFLAPVEHFGCKFDRGSILFEFDALREPERTQFPQIGAYLRARGVEFREVPTPSMLWRGAMWPDLYIANQLAAVPDEIAYPNIYEKPSPKDQWPGNVSLDWVSCMQHGERFHETFIEPMCRKIAGRSSSEIAAKYHRALWLPLYWPATLRARKSIRTPFFYPTAGYAGRAAEGLPGSPAPAIQGVPGDSLDRSEISIAYVLAKPMRDFSVLFVVDDSPIYRITDMDACAGIDAPEHRIVVEYRGECDVPAELARLGLANVEQIAYSSVRLQLPTLGNVAAGWKPRPTINDQLWSILNAETSPR